ncbi:MAG: aminoglycoside phosphotransferase [Kordiimonadales bacterium]|nr:MAG: aminoglycoside phosphotransferase [Kordiimonadales bacterium]
MSVKRLEDQLCFVEKCGWADADIFPLPSDASFRRYIRLVRSGESRMLMDAPPEQEKLGAYLDIQAHLEGLGLRVPKVFAADRVKGFALIEDFGDDTFTELLAAAVDEKGLYLQAADVLAHMHAKGSAATKIDLPAYSEEALLTEVALFTDWFVPALTGYVPTQEQKNVHLDAWKTVLQPVSADRSALVLRDYHVDNLMILPGETGLDSCGLLDFQDALIGSPAYDMVSLVEDARRDVDPAVRAAVLERYYSQCPDIDPVSFERHMALLGAQRHAKVIGIFVRLSRRDGKHNYLRHLPRLLQLLKRHLETEALAPVKRAVEAMVPDCWTAEIGKPLSDASGGPTGMLL